ncbi:FIST C-terminal domain-containing protein [Synechocystis sp. FACHB-383]|uniref:FIST signal transduction protein n=1 Tax=Synechocystis sp. FACHB-383 TaxID=2692864 RepID=UPI001686D1F6|nr:FIST N-terminal domain-containing protein [Synechocystis sp. FACHB-383]MBD2655059.1 FIST C-terminal domain-containing protein [Synechocystis sp. FACHB-383]
MTHSLQWVNALSTRPSLEGALDEAIAKVSGPGRGDWDLAIVFLSSSFASDAARLMPLVQEKLSVPNVIGCLGGGIIGMADPDAVQEVEGKVALSLTVARLPGVKVTPFYVHGKELPDLDASPQSWVDLVGVDPASGADFLILADPMAAGITDFLAGLDFAYPQARKAGGLASGENVAMGGSLFLQSPHHASGRYGEGFIGVALAGNIRLGSVVAQGCRPIGEPFVVNQGERNIITEIEGKDKDSGTVVLESPLASLQKLIPTLSPKDQELAQSSLFVGVANDEFKLTLQPGDFLIRNLLGVDPRQGAIAIGDRVRKGQRLQFHLRDRETSADDLRILLRYYNNGEPSQSPTTAIGALMFSCLGRGYGLYGTPNFDSQVFGQYFPGIALGGFFCNGEIGQVGSQTFLHGYTSAFAIVHAVDLTT